MALEVGGRDVQEDSAVAFVSADGSAALAVVADGLGGHRDGALASQVVVAAAERVWEDLSRMTHRGRNIALEVVEQANRAILALQAERRTDARSTACCAFARDGLVEIASVGDSRAYLVANGAIERLTKDHSVTEMLFASGDISEDAMRGHPDSSRLTQSLGSEPSPRPFVVEARRLSPGEALLLCSDGLWQALSPVEIAEMLEADGADRLTALVRGAAETAGVGGDNVCAVLLTAQAAAARGGVRRLGSWMRQ